MSRGFDLQLWRVAGSGRFWQVLAGLVGGAVWRFVLEAEVLGLKTDENLVVFWDVDAAATLDRVKANPGDAFRPLIPRYDMVMTYGGGPPVVSAYEGLGARQCVPVYNALDPSTHHPVAPDARFECDLALLANRLPDREARTDAFFFEVARMMPQKKFVLGGSGWESGKAMPQNVRHVGHVRTADHNAFNCTPRAVLNVNRESMARYGYSPATRVFEAAGAGACMITDWFEGVETFLEPAREILVARDGAEVARHVEGLTAGRAREIGRAGMGRVLAEHTYDQRAVLVEKVLGERLGGGRKVTAAVNVGGK